MKHRILGQLLSKTNEYAISNFEIPATWNASERCLLAALLMGLGPHPPTDPYQDVSATGTDKRS